MGSAAAAHSPSQPGKSSFSSSFGKVIAADLESVASMRIGVPMDKAGCQGP